MANTLYYGWDKPNDGDGLRNGKPWGNAIRTFMDGVDGLLHNFSQINPMTSTNDIIVGGNAGAMTRLAEGQTGQVLTMLNTGFIGWANPTGGSGSIPTINNGNNGYILSNDGTNPLWIANILTQSGQAGKFLMSTGSGGTWVSLTQIPTMNPYTTAGQFLSNDGSSLHWVAALSNPMTSTNDMIVGGLGGFPGRLAVGSIGQILTINSSGNVAWTSGFSNPMTTYGDLIVGGPSGTQTRLAAGTPGQVLTVYDTGLGYYLLEWASVLTNPMTTAWDIIVGGTGGTATRLAIGAANTVLFSNGSVISWSTILPTINSGTNGQFLTNNGSVVNWGSIPNPLPTMSSGTNGQYLTNNGTVATWSNIPAGFTNPMTTAGDMIVANSGGVAGRMSIGSNGQILTVVSGAPAWQTFSGLPSQAGYSGEFLTTNGTLASWAVINQVPSPVGLAGYFLGSDGTNYSFMALPNPIPSMTGQINKFLTNNGSTLNWAPISTLPSVTGNGGKYLYTDGVGTSWVNISSSTSLGTIPLNFTSNSLTAGQSETDTVPAGCYAFQLMNISVNIPCRIRIYGTAADAAADLSRPSTIDPSNTANVMAEFIFNSTWLSTKVVSPAVFIYNADTTSTQNVYMTIQNLSGSTSTVVITSNIMKME